MLVVEKASSGQKKVLFYRFTISADLHQLAPLHFLSTIGHETFVVINPQNWKKTISPASSYHPIETLTQFSFALSQYY